MTLSDNCLIDVIRQKISNCSFTMNLYYPPPPPPTHTHTHTHQTIAAVLTFSTVQAAVDTTVHMLAAGITLGRVELLDDISIETSNEFSNMDLPVSPTLLLELSGTAAAVEEQSRMAGKYAVYG